MKKNILGAAVAGVVVSAACLALAVFRTEIFGAGDFETGIFGAGTFGAGAELGADSIHEAREETGLIGEKVIGDPDKAKLVVFEYADYGCSHCADWNRTINNLMEKYEGRIALVFRSYDIGFRNGGMAARAATAAQVQGYFKEYKDLLFENQVEWMYATSAEEVFAGYFEEASGGSGDVRKFKEDMASEAVVKRLEFEREMGKKIGLTGTPTFRIDGETVRLNELVGTIERRCR